MRKQPVRRRVRLDWGTLETRSVPTTLVALVDSGVDLSSAGDSPYYDFTYAYDSYDKLAVTPTTHGLVQDTSLQHGHGSTVADFIIAGIAATQAQPGAGTADVKIMPIRETPPGSITPDDSSVVRGVYWAADHGAAVINLSLRQYNQDFYDTDPTDPHDGASLSQAIAYAEARNIAVVTAAGNESINVDGLNPYGSYILPGDAGNPADSGLSSALDNILVTAAVSPANLLTPYTNWGPTTVNFGAPTGSGTNAVTSYSTGYASGVVGVISALTPGLTVGQRVSLIDQTTTPAPQSVGAWSSTGGVINPTGAVRQAAGEVNLSGSFNVVGITANSATAAGNLDGAGNSFSASLLGSTVASGSSTLYLGAPGVNDAVRAAGQIIPLPAGSFGSLRLLAIAVNGQQSVSLTVTYTDGTTATLPVTLDDWHSGATASGESVAVASTYRNGPTGRDTVVPNFNLYSYSLTLDPTRVVKALGLPNNPNVVLFAADLLPASPARSVDLSGSYNVVGITTDATTGPGNLDGAGNSYSASFVGPTAVVGGVSYTLGAPGVNDAVRAAGQTIVLPTGSFGSLRLLATAVNGQQSVSLTVTYTDGTTATLPVTLDDWHSGATASGESVAVASTYRNGPTGRDTVVPNFNLYSYSLTLDPTRVVKGLVLLNNPNVVLFAADLMAGSTARSVDLSGSYNVVGITADAASAAGNLDGAGSSYSASFVKPALNSAGAAFTLGAAGANDAVRASGQTVTLPAGKFSSLRLIGTAVNGTQTGTMTLNYTDGTQANLTQTFDDWYTGPKAPGETIAITSPYRNTTGGRDNRTFSLYTYAIPIDPTRTVASLTLPNNPNITTFALDLVA